MANGTTTYNTYTKRPRSVAEYTMMRGVTDFTNAAQFNAYLSGYQHLVVISVPEWVKVLGSKNAEVQKLLDLFCYIVEYEFKGLDGIEDITVDNIEFTDGISTMNSMGKVITYKQGDVKDLIKKIHNATAAYYDKAKAGEVHISVKGIGEWSGVTPGNKIKDYKFNESIPKDLE